MPGAPVTTDGATPDEHPWMTKSQLCVQLGRSARTVDLWVKAGRVERMQDGSRAYFRLATDGNRAIPVAPPSSTPEMQQILIEIRDELRALRADNEALRAALGALPPAQLPAATESGAESAPEATDGNDALRSQRAIARSWWKRLIWGPE